MAKLLGSTWRLDHPIITTIQNLVLIIALVVSSQALSVQAAQVTNWALVNLTYTDPITHTHVHEHYQGTYGRSSLVEYEEGVAIHVRGQDNTTHGCNDYVVEIPSEKWIAVVERGTCYFSDKIRIATQRYNASAIIIYNSQNREGLTVMKHPVQGVVSVFVSQSLGSKMANLSDSGVRVMVTIEPGGQDSPKSNGISTCVNIFILSVSIAIAFMLSAFLKF